MENTDSGTENKKRIALTSVMAAVFLTTFKLLIGALTGSLGILSEALHSGLDLIAAVITFFAVKFSDLPADKEHNYGHGRIENISALIETFLLVVTCCWIIYEALHRLITKNIEIEVTVWSFIVIATSIIIDITRSRALYRVAKKYNSQALEADALHFSTDIWSSCVVLFGLAGAALKFYYADSIAALVVAAIVLSVSYRMGRKAFDALMDRAPDRIVELINVAISNMPSVLKFHDLRVRESGQTKFVELNIHVNKGLSLENAHGISENVEEEIIKIIPNCKVTVHVEPDEID